jgi:hypothetical protein
LADPERTCLADELAVLEARIGQLLRRLSESSAPPWAQVLETLDGLNAATAGGNVAPFRQNRSPPGAPNRVVRRPFYSRGGNVDSIIGLATSPRLFRTPLVMLVIEPSPGQLTRDAGLLPVRPFDQRIGLTRTFADALDDPRDPDLLRRRRTSGGVRSRLSLRTCRANGTTRPVGCRVIAQHSIQQISQSRPASSWNSTPGGTATQRSHTARVTATW